MRGGWCCIRDGCISMSRTGDDHGPLVDLGHERPQLPARARNLSPIVPRASIAGRALVAVVAIMTFLASITTGAVLLVSASAAEWQSEVASEITIQVRPAAGRDMERDVAAVAEAMRAQPGIVEIKPFTKEESARLLEPWLGTGGGSDLHGGDTGGRDWVAVAPLARGNGAGGGRRWRGDGGIGALVCGTSGVG